MLSRLAFGVVRRRRLVLAVSGLLFVLMAVAVPTVFSALRTGGFDDPASQSSQASKLLDRDFGGQPNLLLLVQPLHGSGLRSLDNPATVSLAGQITSALQRAGDVGDVQSWWDGASPALRARDASSALIAVRVLGGERASADNANNIIAHVHALTARRPGVATVRAGGSLGAGRDITAGIGSSLGLAEGIAVPITLVLLLFVFGNLRAACLPLVVGGFAVAGTFAELAGLGRVTQVSIYAVNLTTALGLGLAVDYSLLMVSRFREQRAADAVDIGSNQPRAAPPHPGPHKSGLHKSGLNISGQGSPGQDSSTPDLSGPNRAAVDQAVVDTMRTAGRTIVFSAATVAVALTSLLLFPVYFLRSFAYAGIGVVLIALLASLTTLPALLATFGDRLVTTRRGHPTRPADSKLWRAVATLAMRRPVAVAVTVLAALLVLGSPFLHVSFGSPDDRVLRPAVAARQVGDTLRGDYDSADTSATDVLLIGAAAQRSAPNLTRRIAELPDVEGRPTATTNGQTTLLRVTGPADTNSGAAQTLVRRIRALPIPTGTRVLVGGPAAVLVDSQDAIAHTLPWALVWISLTTLILLFLFTGSVILPVKALVLNGLSLTAVFGAMVWIFQNGHLSGLLHFTPTPLNSSIVVLMFVVTFGLSMDYEVFLLARIKEAHDAGADTVESVVAGLARSGRIVTTAAALLAITFLAFATASISFLQLFGIGVGIAIVLDATVVRGLLVPALMRLAGELNWWAPPFLAGLSDRLRLTEQPSTSTRLATQEAAQP